MSSPARIVPNPTSARLSPEPKLQLIRAMGRWTLTALVINRIIGSRIFGLPDDVARLLAPWACLLRAIGTGIPIAVFANWFAVRPPEVTVAPKSA